VLEKRREKDKAAALPPDKPFRPFQTAIWSSSPLDTLYKKDAIRRTMAFGSQDGSRRLWNEAVYHALFLHVHYELTNRDYKQRIPPAFHVPRS
jgi:hypothetical protein